MDKYVHLIGAEQVQNAGNSIRGSADQIERAAGCIDESLRMFLNRFEEIVVRMENAMSQNQEAGGGGGDEA